MLLRTASLLLSVVTLNGCDASDDLPAVGASPAAAVDTLVLSEDAGLKAMAEEMLPTLAERSGLTLTAPVRVEYRSRDQLQTYLEAKLDEELPPSRADHMTDVYVRLGLMDPGTDLRALLLEVYREQVAGFYDPDSTALFVLDDQAAGDVEAVLIHELVHAVQDQSVDLAALTDPERGNDRITAAQAAMEGHATLVMMEYQVEQMQGRTVDLTEVPGFADQLRAQMSGMATQYPALAAAPRVIQEGMLFPYLEGAGFVLEAWREFGERPADLGILVPRSTEQVLEPGRFLRDGDGPVTLSLTPQSGTVLYEDNLGQMEVRIFVEELGGAGSEDAVEGWGGDRYVLVESGGERSLVWAVVWDTVADRDRFAAVVGGALPFQLDDASMETRDVDGRPGVVVTVGPAVAVQVSVNEAGE